jgi:hypothetical protein
LTKGLIHRLLGAEATPAKTAPEPLNQLRDPTLDQRASLYLRAVHGKQDFGSEAYSDARNRILNAMATDIGVKLGIHPPDTPETPVDDDEAQRLHALSGRRSEYAYDLPLHAYPDELEMAPAMRLAPRPTLARSEYRAGLRYTALASPRDVYQEDFAAAAPEPEIIPPRRPPVKFSLRTIGTLSIMVCAAALIAGAGTLLFFRNEDSSLAWFAPLRQSAKTEVAIQSSGSKAGSMMPATVQPRMVTSESPGQQPSPEELAELEKRGRALLTAETASRGPSVEVQAVASGSPIQQPSPEELAELEKRGRALLTAETALIGAGTASLLPSLAASQAVASGSPTLAAALAWYQSSR